MEDSMSNIEWLVGEIRKLKEDLKFSEGLFHFTVEQREKEEQENRELKKVLVEKDGEIASLEEDVRELKEDLKYKKQELGEALTRIEVLETSCVKSFEENLV